MFATKIGNPTRYGSVERSVLAVNQHFATEILQIALACVRGEARLVEHYEVGQLHMLQHGRVTPPIHHRRPVGAEFNEALQRGRNEAHRQSSSCDDVQVLRAVAYHRSEEHTSEL